MRSWLQEYFLPYTCTLLRLVTSHLESSVHHVIVRFVCSKDLYRNFVSAMCPGCWISFDLTLQWGNTSFIYHYGHWRRHNRRSWDGFTRIALGSLRALIAFRSRRPLISLSTFVSFRSLGSTRSGRTMLAWGTRPSSSSPYSSLAVYLTGQATQGQLDFSFDGWLLHSCLISCFYFLNCVCGDTIGDRTKF